MFPLDAVDMKRIILIALCLLCIAGSASGYQIYLRCPESVQVGLPLNCSVDSNFPVGTPFEFVFYRSSSYTATPLSRHNVTIQKNSATIYQSFDTKGLSGGQYKVEAVVSRTDEEKLSTDSKTWQLPILIDRSGDIMITSPLSQTFDDALRIEGSIKNAGNKGVKIEVRGSDGVKTFRVVAAVTPVQTTVPTTMDTTRPPTTALTSSLTTTQSPLSPLTSITVFSIIGLISIII